MPIDMQMKNSGRGYSANTPVFGCHENRMPGFKNMRSFFFTIVISSLLVSCSASKYASYNPSGKISAQKLKDDFVLLKKILEANHPSLYWYTPKDSVDWYFNETLQSINDSMTEMQFKNKVAWFISKLSCGHTSVRPSKAYSEYVLKNRQNRFPLLLKAWDDSLVVLGSLNKNDTVFKRGTIITSIENFSNRFVLDSMFRFISTDGYSNNFKNQAISFNFPLYYSFAFPLKDSFLIRYIDASGTQKEKYVSLNKPATDTSKENAAKQIANNIRQPTRKEIKAMMLLSQRSMIYDSSNHLAYMRVATFSGGNLRRFFRESFAELKEKNISNLVIDLRENSGGNINMSALFARYIKDTPFHVADTAAAVSRSLHYSKYIYPSMLYRLAMRFTTSKKADGKFHFNELEHRYFKPYSSNHFNGNIYIIQGGYTFSAAAMFVLYVKGQKNVTVTGEETGGGNYGTSAVHLPEIILPNSKVRVVLPLYRLVPDKTKIKNGRGIIPDIYIPPSSFDIRNSIDPKLQKVKELIQQHAAVTN